MVTGTVRGMHEFDTGQNSNGSILTRCRQIVMSGGWFGVSVSTGVRSRANDRRHRPLLVSFLCHGTKSKELELGSTKLSQKQQLETSGARN